MQIYDIVRSFVTNALLMVLLFTLARPKIHRRLLWIVLSGIVISDLTFNIIFYMRGDYTTLAGFDIAFFVIVSAAIKPLFQETPMQWLFNCFTVMNVYAVNVIASYYLCDLFPYPNYSITALRAILFSAVIVLFGKWLRPLYRQATEHWSVYLFVAAGLFTNYIWYFVSGDDVEQTLTQSIVPLLLLIMLTVLIYMAIFRSLKKNLQEVALREENMKIQSDREVTSARLVLMDEAVRQMTIAQHDIRHLNHMLISLLQQGEVDKAVDLIQRQTEALPQKPRSYCQNVSVNAAVSYYAELARQKGILCELRLDIPENLTVDELSLAMAVSNLMENAIAAVAYLPAPKRKLLFTAVNTGQILMELVNPYEGKVTLDENGLPISANEGHGKGCQSIYEFTEKYGGTLIYELDGGLCKVRMMV